MRQQTLLSSVSPTKSVTLHNLEEWISDNGNARKVQTLAYQVPYGMARGLKIKAEGRRNMPGTFFKIA